jgi:micrococcal nuclease
VPLPEGAEPVDVTWIIDGDTIRVGVEEGREAPVRLIGINAPEQGECYADEATRALAALIPVGTVVGLTGDVSDVDEFGRLLRYVWRGGMFVNEEMVRRGAAIARRYPPDTAMAETLEMAQTEATDAQRGLWDPTACGPRADAVLVIAELEYDAPGDDTLNLNEEWVSVRNEGPNPLDLTGWRIRDESAGNRYRFPDSFTLAPGETVRVRSGCGDDSATDLFWCNVGAAVWDNDGDTAFLLDPDGDTHTSSSYRGS